MKGSIEDFVRSVENIKNLARWNDLTTISVAQCKLKGVALEFIQMKGQQAIWADMNKRAFLLNAAAAIGFYSFVPRKAADGDCVYSEGAPPIADNATAAEWRQQRT